MGYRFLGIGGMGIHSQDSFANEISRDWLTNLYLQIKKYVCMGREEESQGDPTYVHLEYTCTCILHKTYPSIIMYVEYIPVSNIRALITFPSMLMHVNAPSTPIVDRESKLNFLQIKWKSKQDFPTKLSPTNTTLKSYFSF